MRRAVGACELASATRRPAGRLPERNPDMNLQPTTTPPAAGGSLTELAASAAGADGARHAAALAAAGDAIVDGTGPAAITAAKTSRATTSATGTARRTSATGYAKAKSTSSSSTTSKAKSSSSTTKKATTTSVPKDLAFLSDPRLSVEEKLFRFMQYYAARYDQQLEAKMKEIAARQGAAKSSGTTGTSGTKKTKKKGLLSRIGGALKKLPVVGVALELLQTKEVAALLKQLSGPVLAAGATALGMPMLAPVLLKAGPELAGALTAVAKELDDGGAAKVASGATSLAGQGGQALASAQKATSSSSSSKSSTSTSSSTASSSSAGSQDLSTADSMEIQRIQEKQREMFTLVSNLLKSMHDTKMTMLGNLRA
jgi:hypothetical protein